MTESAKLLQECVGGPVRGAFQQRYHHLGVELRRGHLQRGRHDRVILCWIHGHQIWQVRSEGNNYLVLE